MFPKTIAEFIGTFAIVFFGCGSILLESSAVPLVFGMTVAVMIYTVGHISGAHFNPAVTLAFALARHFPVHQVIPYVLAQCTGSITAAFALSMLLPDAQGLGVTLPAAGVGAAFAWETLLSFFLMFVITAVATDTRAEGMMAGIAIGGIVAIAASVGGPFSGASMNPARSLGPALLSGQHGYLWVYLTAPLLGAALGAFTYRAVRCEVKPGNAKSCC